MCSCVQLGLCAYLVCVFVFVYVCVFVYECVYERRCYLVYFEWEKKKSTISRYISKCRVCHPPSQYLSTHTHTHTHSRDANKALLWVLKAIEAVRAG